ncbi:hypothetical protein [Hyphomicrobium sp.]|uniref:hypothetical protein n=1 Tax=Hyphomicrobium sp. TaxID=82 RepID=UPI0025C68761|nr:hypothetical protein [Hyphomicrobium sp.]MCC7252677.1 hypothetical protein [Hyphomicrobium sp.]
MTEDAAHGWVDATLAGFRAMGASRHAEAAHHWLAAWDALAPTDMHDPRRAAGQTNAGVAYLLLQQAPEAEAMLAEAERGWMRVLGGIATANVPVPGRSSSFHFRLASRHLEAFQNAQRTRLARQCEAGLAIARFNRLVGSARPAAGDALVTTLAAQLADILGPRSAEVRLLRASAEAGEAHSPYADKAVELTARRGLLTEPSADDWRHLEVAVQLTALLRPGLDPGARSDFQEADMRLTFSPAAVTSSGSQ